jgi:GntR family transcriptional regulator/MocR family aminotransferase
MLVEQIRTRVLPKRGIVAAPDEILITLGSQNALYLLTRLLMSRQTRVAVENPGFAKRSIPFCLTIPISFRIRLMKKALCWAKRPAITTT